MFAQSLGVAIQLPESPSVSPDGQYVAFAWNGDIWTVACEGGLAKRLTNHPSDDSQPKFSPDGKQIAFVSARNGARQLFVLPAEGGLPAQKSFHSEDYLLIDWFPDGKYLLALSPRDHYWKSAERLIQVSVEKRDAEKILVDAYATSASISPDGKSLLITREGERWWRKGYVGERASQIWKFELETHKFTELLHERVECRHPIWLPNGKDFYFTKGASHGSDLYRYRAARGDSDKPRQRKLASFDDDSIVQPSLSRDGKTMVFRHRFDLYRLRFGEDKQPVQIPIQVADEDQADDRLRVRHSRVDEVNFSPNGLNMVFSAGSDLWVMDTELREPRQITFTDALEDEASFTPDGKSIVFRRMLDGQIDVWMLEPKEKNTPWWQQREFIETRLTESAATESRLQVFPDGKSLAFADSQGDLNVFHLETKQSRLIYDGFDEAEFVVSPDSRWICYAASDEYFNREIWLVPSDGSQPATNVSQHPDNDSSPAFSPDGKMLAFVGTRGDDEVDIYYVHLEEKLAEETARDRALAKALQAEKPSSKSSSSSSPSRPTAPSILSFMNMKPPTGTTSSTSKAPPTTKVDLKDIHLRVKRIATPNSSDRKLLFSGDSKRLFFEAMLDGKAGLYSVEFPDKLQPKFVSPSVFSQAVWNKTLDAIVGNSKGVPARLKGEELKLFPFTAYHERSREGRYRQGFNATWLTMRDIWYDVKLGGKNWDAVRRKYVDAAAKAPDMKSFTTIVEMMLGELNGSHLGFSPIGDSSRTETSTDWNTEVAHLGVRFDSTFAGPGLLVRDVLPGGPADREVSKLFVGDKILSIDGHPTDAASDLIAILDGRLNRDITLKVQRKPASEEKKAEADDGKNKTPTNKEPTPTNKEVKPSSKSKVTKSPPKPIEETVVLRPVSYAQARLLLYDHWLEHNRKLVEEGSAGRLGYLHIKAMDTESFHEFETQLYRVGYGRDGLVIDVRDNGGGSTTDYLLTALTQPQHAITIPRNGKPGYPQDRCVFATWNKPIIVLCNQNSYSNAEIFSHAIKNLGRGKLVGVQTAGGVVSTGAAMIADVGLLRIPFRGWFDIKTGTDMELHGALPDVVIWPAPDDLPKGIDRQLETATKMLLETVNQLPPPITTEYATERKP